jgi:ATP-dependent Clp protease ATP-binding subunit ClpC
MMELLSKRLKDNDIDMEVTEEAKELLAKKGFDQVFGARPLRRAIQSMVEDKLAEEMLEGRVKAGDKVVVEREGDELVVKKSLSLNK